MEVVLIDANSLIHRVYHALPRLTDFQGRPTNALYGLSNILLKFLKERKPDYIFALYDRPEPTLRHQVFKEYKAQRPKAPDDLKIQIGLSKKIFLGFNIPIIEKSGYEADDLIASLKEKFKPLAKEIIILTGDLDTLQLIDEKTKIFTMKKGISEIKIYDINEVKNKFGILPEKIPDFKVLVGDKSDNIPGVPGIGEKTASLLTNKFGDLEKIIEEKKKIYPPLPLDTENAQRLASHFLKFPPKKTMFILQKLFESGFITYHRTDSHRIDKNFSLKIRDFISKNYGENYFSFPRKKKEKISFEAHEAIRPTFLEKPNLTGDFLKLWQLILMVTIASHFKPLEYLETKYLFTSDKYHFLAINKTLIFDGFSKVYPIKEKFLPKIKTKEGKIFSVLDFEIKKIETKPPSRFTETSLIKKMKELGIGRPSTYVPTLEILKKRKYVIKEKNFLKPTQLGYRVYKFLKENYPELIDLKFTASMEEKLDEIALNKLDYQKFVIDFWKKIDKNLTF